MNELFRYIGDTKIDDMPYYQQGEVYMLNLMGRGFMYTVKVTAPLELNYLNWNEFLKEWERA